MYVLDSTFKNYESKYVLSKDSIININNKILKKNRKNNEVLKIVYE